MWNQASKTTKHSSADAVASGYKRRYFSNSAFSLCALEKSFISTSVERSPLLTESVLFHQFQHLKVIHKKSPKYRPQVLFCFFFLVSFSRDLHPHPSFNSETCWDFVSRWANEKRQQKDIKGRFLFLQPESYFSSFSTISCCFWQYLCSEICRCGDMFVCRCSVSHTVWRLMVLIPTQQVWQYHHHKLNCRRF